MDSNVNINIRLTKLEESYFSLSAHLEGERVLRKVEDDKCKQICDLLAKQILQLKEKQPDESFFPIKELLMNSIDTKINSKIIENKKEFEKNYMKNINTNKNNENFEERINKKIENIEKIYNLSNKAIKN